MTDPHDPREFRQWVSFNEDGTVAAVHQFEASVEQPLIRAVDVTPIGPADFGKLTVDPSFVAALDAAHVAVEEQRVALATARAQQQVAVADTLAAVKQFLETP